MKSVRTDVGNFLIRAWEKLPPHVKTRTYWLWTLGEIGCYIVGLMIVDAAFAFADMTQWWDDAGFLIKFPIFLVVFVIGGWVWKKLSPFFGLIKTW